MLPTEQSFAFSTSSAAKAFKKSPSPSPLQAPDNRSKLTALTFDRWGERPREPLHCVCFGYFLRRSRIALRPPNRSCKLNLPRFNASTLQRFNVIFWAAHSSHSWLLCPPAACSICPPNHCNPPP